MAVYDQNSLDANCRFIRASLLKERLTPGLKLNMMDITKWFTFKELHFQRKYRTLVVVFFCYYVKFGIQMVSKINKEPAVRSLKKH